MSRKNGYVLVDISDGRVMTVGLDTATVDGAEVPGIKIIKNGTIRNFLLPMDKDAGNHTIATLDDIPSPSGGGTKLYKHTCTPDGLRKYEIISLSIMPYSTLEDMYSDFVKNGISAYEFIEILGSREKLVSIEKNYNSTQICQIGVRIDSDNNVKYAAGSIGALSDTISDTVTEL